jgi:hypothetical protein
MVSNIYLLFPRFWVEAEWKQKVVPQDLGMAAVLAGLLQGVGGQGGGGNNLLSLLARRED